MKLIWVLGLVGLGFMFSCDGTESATMTLSFYANEDPLAVISISIDGVSVGELRHLSLDGFPDCEDSRWPKKNIGVGEYFIEYYKDGARYASQTYTVTADDLGACIPLLAYP